MRLIPRNPTDQFAVADRFGLDVGSIDSPIPLAWADFGRVWVARRRGADDVDDLDLVDFEEEGLSVARLPTLDELEESRSRRIEFSVRNLSQAWQGRQVTIPAAIEPGRGPPPPAPEALVADVQEEFPGEFTTREERVERFMAAAENRVLGEVEREGRETTMDEFENDPNG